MEFVDGLLSFTNKLIAHEPVFTAAAFRQMELVRRDPSLGLKQAIHLILSHTDIQILHLDDDYTS